MLAIQLACRILFLSFTSSLYIAPLVSTFGASYVTKNKGRKATVLNASAQNIAMLILGRILLGVGIGFGNQAVPLYLSEMAPAKIRGSVNQLFQLTTSTVPATLLFIGGIFLPETPNSLVEQGRLEEGRRFADLIDASNAAKAIKNPFRNLLKRKIDPTFQQLTGMNSIQFYAPVIFQSLGFGSGASLYSSTITSAALFGRRAFFLEAGCEMRLCSVAIAVTFGIGIFLVVVICVFVLAYGGSWGPLGWLVPSELFPLETRSAGQSTVVCVNMIFTALIAQCFLAALCHLKYGIFLLFAGLILVMSCFIFFLLPEKKQVPIEEIHLLWKNHWFWKRYCGLEKNAHELTEKTREKV
ncbi:hypothetical protein ACJIZ3_014305 [Penstemon smallii]|uniref:Major facilitator superfamily (MFS) profile domain-containing protein n=1 Tax=Penstemon smallii TaxID=265156 RepID=A0ABD3RL43_9LAMI